MDKNINPKRYIGARYVPVFTDLPDNEWQAGYPYKRLTVVLYNRQGYTSKVDVPPTVGNPADNPEYWALTSNYDIRTTNLENNLAKEISDRKSADMTFITDVTVINNKNGEYTFKKTINNTESEIGTINVPQNDPVVEVKDTLIKNDTDEYNHHTISETLASGTSNNITELYIAKKQIVDISLDESGNNLVITTIDQTGTKETKTIKIKEGS